MEEEDGANGTDSMKDNIVVNGRPGYVASVMNQHTFRARSGGPFTYELKMMHPR